MGFLEKYLLSKYMQLSLFVVAFSLLYVSSGSGNMPLGYIGLFIIVLNAALIVFTK